MIRTMRGPKGEAGKFFFSPICELTNIFDDTLKIKIVISLEELLDKGWTIISCYPPFKEEE